MATPVRLVLIALLISACTVQVLTVADVESKQYTSMEELFDDLACPGDMFGSSDHGPVETEEVALQAGRIAIRSGGGNIAELPNVDAIVDGGAFWLLADETDRIFGVLGKTNGFFAMCAPENP